MKRKNKKDVVASFIIANNDVLEVPNFVFALVRLLRHVIHVAFSLCIDQLYCLCNKSGQGFKVLWRYLSRGNILVLLVSPS